MTRQTRKGRQEVWKNEESLPTSYLGAIFLALLSPLDQ
jgi:hypothetical protein